MKNKIFFLTIFVVTSIIFFLLINNYFIIHQQTEKISIAQKEVKKIPIIDEDKLLNKNKNKKMTSLFSKDSSSEKIKRPEWAKNYSAVIKWRRENFGHYYSKEDSLDYLDYDLETLKSLSNQGDFLALHVLALKYVENLDMQNAIKIYELSAIYGSTVALKSLATLYEEYNDNAEVKRRSIINRLAYFKAAILRGDKTFIVDAHVELSDLTPSLTKAEKGLIQKKGKAIYHQILTKRQSLGLPELDKATPKIVEQYYEDTLNEYFEKNSFLQ